MNENLQNALATLAEKFGTTVEHLWGVMLRQATISGILSAIVIVMMLGIIYGYYRAFKWYTHTNKYDDIYEIATPVLAIIGVALTIGSPILFILEAENMLTALLNPEYWALHQLLK